MLDRLPRRCALTLRRRPLLPFLAAAVLAVNLMLLRAEDEFAVTVLFAQAGLLGLWAGQLRPGWALRLIVAALAVLASSVCWVEGWRQFDKVLSLVGVYAGGVAVVSAACRFAGRLVARRGAGASEDSVRFSIWGVLSVTTAVAIAASLLRFANLPRLEQADFFVALSLWGALPLVADQIARRVRSTVAAFVLVMIAAAVVAILFDKAAGGPPREMFLGTLGQGVYLAAWLLGVRGPRGRSKGNALLAAVWKIGGEVFADRTAGENGSLINTLPRRFALTLRRRPLLPFLLAATFFGNLSLSFFDHDPNSLAIPVEFGFVGLLGLWAGQLRSGWVFRLVGLAVGAVFFATPLFGRHERAAVILTLLLVYGAAVAAAAAATRLVGRLIADRRDRRRAPPLRFSIAGVLTVTTVAAVAGALLRHAELPRGNPLRIIVLFGLWGALPLLSLAIARSVRSVVLALVLIMATSLAIAWALASMMYVPDRIWLGMALQGAVIGVWLIGLRSRARKASEPGGARGDPVKASSEPQEANASRVEATAEAPPVAKPLDLEG